MAKKTAKIKPAPVPSFKQGQLIVIVAREADGDIYSEVQKFGTRRDGSVVIDRQHGRRMDERSIKGRAQSLAKILGLPYCEDMRWLCVANEKRPCRCPKCCGACP